MEYKRENKTIKKFNLYLKKHVNAIAFYILVVFCIVWIVPYINQGIDVEDTGYYLTKYKYIFDQDVNVKSGSILFTEIMGGMLYKLSSSHQMLILNIISWLSYLLSGMMIYKSLKRKERDILVIGMVTIGMFFSCSWIRAFNYNSFSMFILVAAIILLLKDIEKDRNGYVVASGALVGINVFIRFPNVLQFSLVLALIWFYGIEKKVWKKSLKKSLLFGTSGIIGGGISVGVAILFLGTKGVFESVIGIIYDAGNGESRHGIRNILERMYDGFEYGVELWSTKLLFICMVLLACIFLQKYISEKMYRKLLKGMSFLFLLLGIRWGYGFEDMYAIYDMTAVFLVVSSFLFITFCTLNSYYKAVAVIVFISELILTIGTDNGWYYQCVFFMFPLVSVCVLWREVLRQAENRMYIKIILIFMISTITAYGIKYATTFVYRDSPREELTYSVDVPVCKGLKTTEGKGKALEILENQLKQCEEENKYLAILGDCSIAWAFTDLKPCFSSAWPDLESFHINQMKEEFDEKIEAGEYPVVLISDFDLNNEIDEKEKYEYLMNVMAKNNYKVQYQNEYFTLYSYDK